MTVLIDPDILLPVQDTADRTLLTSFWSRIVGWSAEPRAYLGRESHAYLMQQYAERNYPQEDLEHYPSALRHEYRRALNKILTRVHDCGEAKNFTEFSHEYVGSAEAHLALQYDIAATGRDVEGLATSSDHWPPQLSTVCVEPPPPEKLDLYDNADEYKRRGPTNVMAVADKFRGRRLHIVGGKAADHVVERICNTTGLTRTDIVWIESERNKKPRDLDKRWAHLDAERDVTVCVTGRIGHAGSAAARAASIAAGVMHLPIESVNQIADVLVRALCGGAGDSK